MPKVRVDLRQDSGGGGGYDNNVTAGYYRIKCVTSKYQKAANGNGNVVWTEWRIIGPQAGGKLLKVFSMQPQATWSFRNMLTAVTSKDVPVGKVIEVDTDSILNKECGVYIGDGEITNRRTGKKMAVSEIKEWLTLTDYQALRAPTRTGAPSVAGAVAEAGVLEDDESDEEFEYEDPEEKSEEGEEVEEIVL